MPEWFEDESRWVGTYDAAFGPEKFAAAEQEVEKLLALTGLTSGVVLDLCCGPGRHLVELAQKGFQVVGVDRTAFLLGKAEARARDRGVTAEFVKEDMRHFVRNDTFDLAICLFNSFGYFDNRDDDLLVLQSVHQSLKGGGCFLLEATSKEVLARDFSTFSGYDLGDLTMFIQREIQDDWNRTSNISIIVRGERVQRFPYHLNLYSGQELKDRMRQAGFLEIELYGDLDGKPYGPGASNLFAVARKTGRL